MWRKISRIFGILIILTAVSNYLYPWLTDHINSVMNTEFGDTVATAIIGAAGIVIAMLSGGTDAGDKDNRYYEKKSGWF